MGKYLLYFILFSICNTALAQVNVSSQIVFGDRTPAGHINVVLHRSADSVLLGLSTSNKDGFFTFKHLKSGKYFLEIRTLGVKNKKVPFEVAEHDVNLDKIIIATDNMMLKEVKVTSSKPFLEQKGEKLIVNVENNLNAIGSSAMEVLQNVPGVLVISNQISVIGKNSVNIQVDGRTSPYTDMNQLLREMPASNIEKIEVITNPGASFDASGAAIINVVTKKTSFQGTNINLGLNAGGSAYSQTKYPYIDKDFYRLNPSLTFNKRRKRLNIFGGANFTRRTFFDYTYFDRLTSTDRFLQSNYAPGYFNNSYARLGADFYKDTKNIIGAFADYTYRNGTINTQNLTNQYSANSGVLENTFKTLIDENNSRKNYDFNLNWKHYLKQEGSTFNMDLAYTGYIINTASDITISDQLRNSHDLQNVNNPISFLTYKADLVSVLSKTATIESGIKFSLSNVNNDLTFNRKGYVVDSLSNKFTYRENINAAYISITKSITGWDFKVGVRAEQTNVTGKTNSISLVDNHYIQIFPSGQISKKLNSSLSLLGLFATRVNRPDYQSLNPFTYFLDSLTYRKGNPYLKPEYTYSGKIQINLSSRPLFSVNYNSTNSVIIKNAPRQVGNVTYSMPENLANYKSFFVEGNLPINFRNLNGFVSSQVVLNKYNAAYLNAVYDRYQWSYVMQGQLSYKISDQYNIQTNGFYTTKTLKEFLSVKPQGGLNLAFQKSFDNNLGKIGLNFTDILYTQITKADILYQNLNVKLLQRSDTRSIRLSITYVLGNEKLKNIRGRNFGNDEEDKRVIK